MSESATARTVTVRGKILYLTEDPQLLESQLGGKTLAFDPERALIGSISTDEITPGWVCYYYDETLARYSLIGLRGGAIKKDTIKDGGFGVIVSGISKGCGSSRETAPYSELKAGVQIVIAKSIEKIYRQNAQNIGLLTSTDFGLIPRIERGEAIPMSEFTRGLDPISAGIVERGGLFAYNRARLAGDVTPPAVTTPARKMTPASDPRRSRHRRRQDGQAGVTAVTPGDVFFARTDVRFSHEYVTPMADAIFRAEMGEDAKVTEPESVFAFRDHLTFLDLVMPKAHRDIPRRPGDEARRGAGRLPPAAERALAGEVQGGGKPVGSEAICHNKVIEEIAPWASLPASAPTRTSRPMAPSAALCSASAPPTWRMLGTPRTCVTVPETARFVLTGMCPASAPRTMLHILAMPFFKGGDGIGKVLEFAGEGVRAMSLDERATLTNMAVEAGGFTGIIEADEVVVDYLVKQRGANADDVRARIVRADEGATYLATFDIDLSKVVPMVATPGDPRNGIALTEVAKAPVAIPGRVRRPVHRRQEDGHGHVRRGPRRRGEEGEARRPGCAPSTSSSARKTFAATPRRRATSTSSSRRRARRSAARASRRPRRERLARSDHRELAEPQLPRPERPGQGVSCKSAGRRRERHRRTHRRPGRHLITSAVRSSSASGPPPSGRPSSKTLES
ncbi:MAG: aconitase family protein [Polyangiaceae bacterium]